MKTLLLFCLLLGLSACATPERRIRANPELFEALPLEQRERVRQGEVSLGFSPEAVRLAKGNPHRVYRRQSAAGESSVWSYVRQERRSDSQWVDVPSRGGRFHSVRVDVDHIREVEVLRIEFADGQVTAIEEIR